MEIVSVSLAICKESIGDLLDFCAGNPSATSGYPRKGYQCQYSYCFFVDNLNITLKTILIGQTPCGSYDATATQYLP